MESADSIASMESTNRNSVSMVGTEKVVKWWYIIKVFLYLILAVMTLIHWLLKIPMILRNILL